MDFIDPNILKRFGIVDWGYTKASSPTSWPHFENWIKNKKEGALTYLSDHRFKERQEYKNIFEEFQGALVFLFDYSKTWMALNHLNNSPLEIKPQVASYTLAFGGEDYHKVLNRALEEIKTSLQERFPKLKAKSIVDIYPVLERDLAYQAGLGWFGKNSMLINRQHGSLFLIGSLFVNIDLDISQKFLEGDHCGQCRACLDACPTSAIEEKSRTIIADKCISTFTIETFKDTMLPPSGYENSQGYIFGCDICQNVCPWNQRLQKNQTEVLKLSIESEFEEQMTPFISNSFFELKEKLEKKSLSQFKKDYSQTSFGRTGKKGILKNLRPFMQDS